MPKLKSVRGSKKRFRPTAKGYKYRQSHRNHILTKKSTKRKRGLRHLSQLDSSDVLSVRRMLNGS